MKQKIHLFISVVAAMLLGVGSASATVVAVSGKVVDKAGAPLMGAGVVVKGTTNGVITDLDGNYSIKVEDNATLVVSYIGYISQETEVGGRAVINFTLEDDTTTLDDVVVVGYATMKKRDLVGAVDAVDSKVIENRPNGNLARSLQGEVAGLNISFTDGKPSRSASFNVRGSSSIGAGGSALVLIDGAEGSLDAINPQDVESVSVLKDASSTAVYGARGAFGVILVTTKSSKQGRVAVNYNGSVSVNRRTIDYQNITDSIEWLDWWKTCFNNYYNGTKALLNHIDSKAPYSEDIYNEILRRNADPGLSKVVESDAVSGFGYAYYGNTDWMNEFYKPCNTTTEHNVSVSGGSDIADFYVSGRYYGSDGIYKVGNENYKKYDVRAKGTVRIRPWIKITNNLSMSIQNSVQPRTQNGTVVQKYMQHCLQPMAPIKNPDGNWSPASAISGYAAFSDGNNYMTDKRTYVREKVSLDIDIVKDILKFQADYAYNYTRRQNIKVQNMVAYSKSPDVILYESEKAGDGLTRVDYDTHYHAFNAYLTYSPKLKKGHSFTLLAGWNTEWQNYETLNSSRNGFTTDYKFVYNLMDGEATLSQGGNEWSYAGAFFRANYSWKSRYLLEVSGRYDGSSKFPSYSKWGFFPSASAGWRLSDEPWMDWSNKWLDNAKIRASFGTMGNGAVSPYQYTSEMALTKASDIVLGGGLPTYTTVGSVVPTSLTWERSSTYDIGLDLDLLRNRLSFTGDYYVRMTTDMYTPSASLPSVYGTTPPKGNNAEMRTNGWEVSLMWRDDLTVGGRPFSYSIRGTVWDNRSFITKYAGNDTRKIADSMSKLIANNCNPSNYYQGMEIGEIWGYTVEGLFKDFDDIANHATQTFQQEVNKTTLPGQVKVADLNEDSKIDYGALTTSDSGDLKIIGNSQSRFNYGLNFSVNWNGIGLSMFFQGVGKKDWYPGDDCGYFWGKYSRPFFYFIPSIMKLDNPSMPQMSEDGSVCLNADTAYWPRVSTYQSNGDDAATKILEIANTRYMQNAAYIRLKNLQIDYSFNKKVCKALHMSALKIYLSGENLFCFTPLHKWAPNLDPEGLGYDTDFASAAQGNTYPLFKTYTFGLNLTF